MKISPITFLLSISLLFVFSCKNETPVTDLDCPEEEELYIFPYKTQVDTKGLSCGYKNHEHWSDKVKKLVRSEVGEVSVEEQKAIGAVMHEQYVPYTILENGHQERRVRSIIQKMKPFLLNQDLDYHTYILETPAFMAFTMPGGNIYVSSGLLEQVQSDDALAYIVGHELGHNENGHTREGARLYRYTEQELKDLQESDSFWSGLWEAIDVIKVMGIKMGADFFNQSDELEADITGIYLAYMAGFDPEKALAGVTILKKLDAPKPESDIKAQISAFFRSHPWTEDREKCARAYVENAYTRIENEYEYENGAKATINTPSKNLHLLKYPNENAEKLEELPDETTVFLVCDAKKMPMAAYQWTYVQTEKGVAGWVRKKDLISGSFE